MTQTTRSKKLSYSHERITCVVQTPGGISLFGTSWPVAWRYGESLHNSEQERHPLIRDRDGLWEQVLSLADAKGFGHETEFWSLVGVCVPSMTGFNKGHVLWAEDDLSPQEIVTAIAEGRLDPEVAQAMLAG